MTSYFLDTSALAKHYVEEIGSGWIRSLVATKAHRTIAVCDLTPIEFFAVLARRQREGLLTEAEQSTLQSEFLTHLEAYLVIPLKGNVLTNAREFVTKYPLRPPDALQLASALYIARDLGEDAVFLCADHQLLAAAEAEGLATDNPNLHP